MIVDETAAPAVLRAATPRDLGRWSEAAADAMVRFDITPPSPSRFTGWMTTRRAGSTAITSLRSSGHVLHRPRKAVDDGGLALINLITGGSAEVTQNEVRTSLRPGDISIYHEPNEMRFVCGADYSCLCVSVPSRALPIGRSWWDDPERLIIRGDAPLGAALGQAMTSVHTASAALDGPGLHRSVDDGVRYLGALLASGSGTADDASMASRIERFIDARLSDPDLDGLAIARAHHMSLRRVYQVLAEAGTTPASAIRARRLEAVRRMLLDPAHRDRTVSECASAWGFTNPSHFGALFRSVYGQSPARYVADRRD